MNVFGLSFKSDKDLHEFLNYGEGNVQNQNNQEKNEKTDINYQIENLINNSNENISIWIRDSNSPKFFSEQEKK